MKTVRRDYLKRLCAAGRLVLVSCYSFDDMYGADRRGEEMPCMLAPKSVHDRRYGICYLRGDEFSSSSGSAWENQDGTITLHVHSNSNYTFKVTEELL